MKNSKVLKAILVISGLIGAGVGAAILFAPVVFYASSGIDLGVNVSLLNEIRPTGGALLACGIVIILGAFVSKFTFTSTVISILLYLSYGLSRILSIAIDGTPIKSLVVVTVLEIVIGLLCVYALLKYRDTSLRV